MFSTGFSSTLATGQVSSTTAADTLSFGGGGCTSANDLTAIILANMRTFSSTGAITLARGGTGATNQTNLSASGAALPIINLNGTGLATDAPGFLLSANTTIAGTGSAASWGLISGSANTLTHNAGTNTVISDGTTGLLNITGVMFSIVTNTIVGLGSGVSNGSGTGTLTCAGRHQAKSVYRKPPRPAARYGGPATRANSGGME